MTKQKPKIVVSEKLKSKLNSLGEKKDTYENIIWKLIAVAEKVKGSLK